jgi:hypothetical protein
MAWASRYKIGVTLSTCWLLNSLPVLAQDILGRDDLSKTPGMSADRQPAVGPGLAPSQLRPLYVRQHRTSPAPTGGQRNQALTGPSGLTW